MNARTPAHRTRRIVHRCAAAFLAVIGTACGAASDAGGAVGAGGGGAGGIDLLATLPAAERRALLPADQAVRVTQAGPAGQERTALVTAAPSRVIWSTRLPAGGRLRAALSLVPVPGGDAPRGATARIGISDERIFEQLLRVELGPEAITAWRDIEVDLSGYGGFQWSLFYHPSRTTWRVIFSTDATPEGAIAWADAKVR